MFDDALQNKISTSELQNNSHLIALKQKFNEAKIKLGSLGPTSKLWIQYIKMIDIFKSNVRADRIGKSLELKFGTNLVKKTIFSKVTISSTCRLYKQCTHFSQHLDTTTTRRVSKFISKIWQNWEDPIRMYTSSSLKGTL